MNSFRDREVALFNFALQLPLGERAAYLELECSGDNVLRRKIDALLQVYDQVGTFLEHPTQEVAHPASGATGPSGTIRGCDSLIEKTGGQIGNYKLLQQIGEGGCGVVYMAEQTRPLRRKVALKIIKLGMDTKHVIARFEAERQALALMDHPNIAKVLDAGATETGRPFFVMELVRGIKITDYCDENQLPTRERLKLFTQVCQAVQHAHQKGIIHRDIKPSNILVADYDGMPVPKVIDFGIAKATTDQQLTDKTLFTALEQFIGTPAYMSPEQAKLSGLDIDTRTDIYSLGVLLYELLTGKTPFDAKELLDAGLEEMRRTIREQEPARPSTALSAMLDADLTTVAKRRQADAPKLVHLVRGDLDWIVMKALEKDRNRRYETANGLALDVQRHLKNEPIEARPAGSAYRFRKTFLRHKTAFAISGAFMIVLLAAVVISTSTAMRAKRAEQQQIQLRARAESGEKKARLEAIKTEQTVRFLQNILQSAGPFLPKGGNGPLMQQVLESATTKIGQDLKDQPEVEADLRVSMGGIFQSLGKSAEAEIMYREALPIYKKMFGNNDVHVFRTLSKMGDTLTEERRFPEAEEAYRQAFESYKNSSHYPDSSTHGMFDGLADALQQDGKLQEMDRIFDEWIMLAGNRTNEHARLLRSRGTLRAKVGRWGDAVLDFTAANRLALDGGDCSFDAAVVFARARQTEEYRLVCHAYLERCATSRDFVSADMAAKASLLMPMGKADFDRACELADFAATETEPSWHIGCVRLGKALAEYRRGRLDSATTWAERALRTDGTTPRYRATAYFIEALACMQLGKSAPAQTASARGDELMRQPRPAFSMRFGDTWCDWEIAELLRNEVRTCLNEKEERTVTGGGTNGS